MPINDQLEPLTFFESQQMILTRFCMVISLQNWSWDTNVTSWELVSNFLYRANKIICSEKQHAHHWNIFGARALTHALERSIQFPCKLVTPIVNTADMANRFYKNLLVLLKFNSHLNINKKEGGGGVGCCWRYPASAYQINMLFVIL